MHVKVLGLPIIRIDAPEIFRDRAFVEWLNREGARTATWHKHGGEPTEWSDVFVTYGGECEGSDSDMPEHIWDKLCNAVKEQVGDRECLIWLTNVFGMG